MSTPSAPTTAPQPAPPVRRGYLAQSSDAHNSVLLVLPLFVVYQIGILLTDGWMNGVDFVTSRLMQAVDGNILWYLGLNVGVLLAGLLFLKLQASRARIRPSVLIGVLVESTVYAFIMGRLAVLVLLQVGLRPTAGPGAVDESMGLLDSVVLSIGAGTYEELVFRVGLLWGSYRLWTVFRPPSVLAFTVALALSSLVFSAIHYAPIGMDDFNLWSFFFRVLLGVMFGVLFWFRGFAVAVYTHAIYDIVILVPRSMGLGG